MNKKKQVLVVDDDIDILNVLNDFLTDEGHAVIIVNNGEEAVNKVKEHKIDLAVLDISMPKMTGIEALIRIKEIQPALTAIMITAFRNPEIIKDALNAGALDCVFKPFDLKDLRHAVHKALNINK